MAVPKEEVEIVKPRTDKREYRRVVLRNALECLLISDPETDKAAASMDVSVGAFSDPDGLEGLAHFLEHMLFYASEKYPLEDSYSKYISEHGGRTNAFTSSEHTNYHFDINADCFEEALDRFAQFFIKPLMSGDATTREIKAVDSENQKNLLSDTWRMNQLQKHLSTENHPYHKFSTGNWDTLETRPKEKGLDTRMELIKFYEENYSANLMHLVVYGKDSLDGIQRLVESKFQDIRTTERRRACFPGQPCTSEHLQILVKAVRIKQGNKLRIIWPITPSIRFYNEGPCRYLGHLIGHEGDGSLFSILKTLGWATGLYAGESDWTEEFSFFTVVIELTESGHEHMQDVVGLLFKYVHLLRKSGVCKWIFDELSAVCQTTFHYQDKSPPISYVVKVASDMKFYPPKDWLVQSCLPSKFSPDTIQRVLDELTSANVRIFWESQKFEGVTDRAEPWYGTAYSVEKVASSIIEQWMSAAPDVNMHLPVPNLFIPTDLSLKDVSEKVIYPILLRRSSCSTLWYKPNTMFSTPKTYLKIYFKSPYASNSPESEVLTEIFTRLVMDYLNEYAYYAQIAGLHYAVTHAFDGFEVTLLGYSHKLRILLETVIDKIANFQVIPDRFSVIKETVTKVYQNFKFDQPYQQALLYCTLLLKERASPWTEELEVLPHLEAEDLAKFAPTLLSRAALEAYIGGNVEPQEAESMIKHVEDVFFKGDHPVSRPLFSSQQLAWRVVKLNKGTSYVYPAKGLNASDENSALVHYIQVHRDDFMSNVKLQLFALLAKQPAFHQLRSVEQLGYITALIQRSYCGIHGVQIIIQSTVKGPAGIDSRVEAFLRMFESKLYEMSSEEFKRNVNTLIDMKLEKYKNIREESGFFWEEIVEGTLRFDRKESEVAALRRLTQQELIDYFNEHIKVGAPSRKSLSVRVYGSLHSSDIEAETNEASQGDKFVIDDMFVFRKSQPLYGSFSGVLGNVKL